MWLVLIFDYIIELNFSISVLFFFLNKEWQMLQMLQNQNVLLSVHRYGHGLVIL